ncbi:MAG: hypothetical protein J0G94_06555, partial [Sphingomonadales bacterium]|nr:hypothetical protein [Sphingomonadales bacterium]
HFIMEPREEEGELDVRCFFQIVQFQTDYHTNFVFGIGTRVDHVTNKEGPWRFQSLHVNAWTAADQVPWKGELLLKQKPRHVAPPVAGKQ